MDFSDLPVYDEEYTTAMKHQSSLTVFVRNLEQTTDEQFGGYMSSIQDMMPDHATELYEHERIWHDEVNCPAEDVDPFELNDATSYTKALVEEKKGENEEEEEDLYFDLYNMDSNTSG